MLAGKMVFAGGSTHEAVAQLAYSALFWGLVAMPQLIGPSFIGELSVLFQEHKIRVGVLDWRGKRKVRDHAVSYVYDLTQLGLIFDSRAKFLDRKRSIFPNSPCTSLSSHALLHCKLINRIVIHVMYE